MPRVSMQSKYDLIPEIVERTRSESILDVGCRDNVLRQRMVELRPELDRIRYSGADLFQNQHNGVEFLGDFSAGLPVPDSSYDLVSAFDVLEHVDDLQRALDELIRI